MSSKGAADEQNTQSLGLMLSGALCGVAEALVVQPFGKCSVTTENYELTFTVNRYGEN